MLTKQMSFYHSVTELGNIPIGEIQGGYNV